MNVVSELTIGQVAELLGVSTRTPRHWDDIGLLQPSFRSWGDYRLYTESDIDTAMEILVYRETGMPLKDIVSIIHGGASTRDRLREQQEYLAGQIARLRRMHDAVTAMIERNLTMTEKMEALGDQWAEEAEARWGETPEWGQAQERRKNVDMAAAQQELEAFAAALVDAAEREVAPGSPEAKKLVERHRAQIEQWYDCTREKQVCLARMYVADERFHEAYAGQQENLLKLVEAQAELEGIDLAQVQWR